ncbi:MAG: cysteine desulfurase [Clostridia bacterium]|nr:cysteine desulfurase [Clostridiales bacterium]MDK2985289.1 cysteine desulfurase [Clostridia bacterium]
MTEIYLDNSATTKPLKTVVEEMQKALEYVYANPSSLHGMGVEAEKILRQARDRVAKALNVSSREIFFTSGGTEANNWAIIGGAFQNKGKGKHLITSEIEHASVLAAFKKLEEEGFNVSYIPVDEEGVIKLDKLQEELTKETILVSIMHVNNEVGSMQPISEISKILEKYDRKPLFHVDAVQSFGKLPLSPQEMGIDLLTVSGHKIHGPKGVGALFIRKGVNIKPLLVGGEQEANLRAGTENVPGIVGMGRAAEEAERSFAENVEHLTKIRDTFLEKIKQIEGVHINGSPEKGAPHIVNIYFEGIEKSEVLIHILESYGVYVSSGSACHSRRPEASHVLKAMGLADKRVNGSIRISFSKLNEEKEIAEAVRIIKESVEEMRSY